MVTSTDIKCGIRIQWWYTVRLLILQSTRVQYRQPKPLNNDRSGALPTSNGFPWPSTGPDWRTHATSLGTRAPLENFSAPATISSTSNVPYPLPLQTGNPLGYVGYYSFPANRLISDSISQRNSKQSPLHCFLDDLKPSGNGHCERTCLSAICHHCQHTLVINLTILTIRIYLITKVHKPLPIFSDHV